MHELPDATLPHASRGEDDSEIRECRGAL